MVEQFHGEGHTKRFGSGGRLKKQRDKRLYEIGGPFAATKVSEEDYRKSVRGKGGILKVKLLRASIANVVTPTGIKKAKIKKVLESPDNRHYARMNIITKGALLETELGKAKVTNRPAQDGVVHARLVS